MNPAQSSTLLALVLALNAAAQDANRFTYLDQLDPYYVHSRFPKLTTPQWIGEPGVDAAIFLSIDDMRRDEPKYEAFLRPILNRLKRIDGRAPVSIFTRTVDPASTQVQTWLAEGVSIEAHTAAHACPMLGPNDSLDWTKADYDACVDEIASIPNNRPVAFRTPCCDSLNTPSPRLFAEIINETTPAGRFLQIDTSVFNIPAPNSPQFRKYLPFKSFVNTIEDYPCPYVIGNTLWEFPCAVPSDWEGHNLNQSNSPITVADLKASLDDAVAKKGVYVFVFHPHGWIRSDQIVELIDHAVSTYGSRVKFLNFREAADRLTNNLTNGQPLRDQMGRDNGIRLLDLNSDGYLDVLAGNAAARFTRIWNPSAGSWEEKELPFAFVDPRGAASSVQIGALDHPYAILRTESAEGAWEFRRGQWHKQASLVKDLAQHQIYTSIEGRDQGVRLRDMDRDGISELLVANPSQHVAFTYHRGWRPSNAPLPDSVLFVDAEGRDAGTRFIDLDSDAIDELLLSDDQGFGVYRFIHLDKGWQTLREGTRSSVPPDDAIPPFVVNGQNNGAWFHSSHLWIQNEFTDKLPDHVDRRSYEWLLRSRHASMANGKR